MAKSLSASKTNFHINTPLLSRGLIIPYVPLGVPIENEDVFQLVLLLLPGVSKALLCSEVL